MGYPTGRVLALWSVSLFEIAVHNVEHMIDTVIRLGAPEEYGRVWMAL